MITRLRQLLRRLRATFRRDALDRELDDELRFHLEMQTRDNAADGVPPLEAAQLARRQFGHVDCMKETVRARRSIVWLESVAKDFRYSARSLTKAPGFSISVVATLALGLGAATAILSLGRNILSPRLPFVEPEQLVSIQHALRGSATVSTLVELDRFAAYRERATSFEGMVASRTQRLNLVLDGQPHPVSAMLVTDGYFALLDVSPRLGRDFRSDEFAPDANGSSVIISDDVFHRHFGGALGWVGRDVLLGGRHRRLIGVLPHGFEDAPGWGGTGFYLPMAASVADTDLGRLSHVTAIGRLKRDRSPAQAEAELATIKSSATGPIAEMMNSMEPRLLPLTQRYQRMHTKVFWVFIGAVTFLYVIACVNAMNLLLVRAVGRQRELGTRLALGGSRGRILQLLVVEGLILSGLAGLVGTALACVGYSTMGQTLPYLIAWSRTVARPDTGLLLAGGTLSVLTGFVTAVVPVVRLLRKPLDHSLRQGVRSLDNSRSLERLRGGLIVVQATAAVVLLAAVGLMLRSLHRLQHVELGFDPNNRYYVTAFRTPVLERTQHYQLADRIAEAIAVLPGVVTATPTGVIPFGAAAVFTNGTRLRVEGQSEPESLRYGIWNVGAGYLDAIGQPLRAGRDFDDVRPGDPPVFLINETLARRLFPNDSPLGRQIDCGTYGKGEVIGIVGDVHEWSQRQAPSPQVLMPYWQNRIALAHLYVVVHLAAPADATFAHAIRQTLFAIDPALVVSFDSLAADTRQRLHVERYTRDVLRVVALIALILAALGLFSVTACAVAARRAELGLRSALGAMPHQLFGLILRRGLLLAGAGVALGLAAAAGLTRSLQSPLYETSPFEPPVYGTVAIGLLLVAALACWLPARQAAKIDPATALRAE